MKMQDIFEKDFIPTHDDVLKARIRTTGCIDTRYEVNNVNFDIHDFGGARNERRKWIHSFENVTAVLYMVPLDHYNDVLREDESKNAMHESVQLFDELVNSKWFKRTEFILFFNKKDVFAELLRKGVSLSYCFSSKYGWDGPQWNEENDCKATSSFDNYHYDEQRFEKCYETAIQFITDVYLSKNQNKCRRIYCHVTDATDRDQIEKVFWDVQDILIRSNLRVS